MDDTNTPQTPEEEGFEGTEEEEAPERPDIPEIVTSRTVGEMLAAERRRQGKSVGDIAEATNIRLRMLQALEDSVYDQLPSPAYVKGYIQNYATVLDLSPEPFLEAYRQEAPRAGDSPSSSAALGDPILPHRDQAHAIPGRLLVGVVVFVAVVGLIWVTLSLAGRGAEEPAPLPPTNEEAPVSEPQTEAVPGVTEEAAPEAEEPTEQATAESFEMTVSIDDDDASWLRVTVDGEKVYEGTLDGGESRTWTVTDAAAVRIGRPSVVSVTRDGQDVPIPGGAELPTVELFANE